MDCAQSDLRRGVQLARFRFRYEQVTYIHPDLDGWGHPGTVLFGCLEVGTLRAGQVVGVATASGVWHRAVTTLADPNFRSKGTPEYPPIVVADSGPVELMVYFGSHPPERNVLYPGMLEDESQ